MKSRVDVSPRATDPFAFLEAQHREVESLFAELERVGSGSVRPASEVFLELATKLEAHAQLEEAVFYPLGRKADEKQTLEAYEEHKLCRIVIEDIRKGRASGGGKGADTKFEAHVKVLKELVAHHVKEEEGTYFPTLRKELDDAQKADLGQRLQETYPKLEAKIARAGTATKAKTAHKPSTSVKGASKGPSARRLAKTAPPKKKTSALRRTSR